MALLIAGTVQGDDEDRPGQQDRKYDNQCAFQPHRGWHSKGASALLQRN